MEELLSEDCKTSRTFGVVKIPSHLLLLLSGIGRQNKEQSILKMMSKVGTTAEVRSMRDEGDSCMVVVAKGIPTFFPFLSLSLFPFFFFLVSFFSRSLNDSQL